MESPPTKSLKWHIPFVEVAFQLIRESVACSHSLFIDCGCARFCVGYGLYMHVSPKRCKIGGKLVLIINIKSYMSFWLIPNSVTLNDLERRNGPYFAWFLRNLVILEAYCVNVVHRAITINHLQLLCVVVNVCRETARRPRYKFLADW